MATTGLSLSSGEQEQKQERPAASSRQPSIWASKYRGATVEDLDPPPALSTSPASPISSALLAAFERDYTHLTVLSPDDKSLLGYISVPHLQSLLQSQKVRESDPVAAAMIKFKRGRQYKLITMETPLQELEYFFEGEGTGRKEDFAVVTDPARRFVLGVATREDLTKFAERRPF